MARILLVLTVRKSRGHFERVDRCRVGRKGACLLSINTAAEELKLQMMETSERVLGEYTGQYGQPWSYLGSARSSCRGHLIDGEIGPGHPDTETSQEALHGWEDR